MAAKVERVGVASERSRAQMASRAKRGTQTISVSGEVYELLRGEQRRRESKAGCEVAMTKVVEAVVREGCGR